jgi:hypothetical protein
VGLVPGSLGIVLCVCLVACTSSTARLPRVTFGISADRFETKMLRPGARTSACRTTLLGVPVAGSPSPLESALRALLASDPEADQLSDVEVREQTVASGVVNRTCVTVRANVVRMVPVVLLPMPASHHGHHH